MNSDSFFRKIPLQLWLILGVALLTIAICRWEWFWAISGLTVCSVYIILYRWRLKNLKEQCWIILEAVRNADYTFRFHSPYSTYEERVLQQTLNDFGHLMAEQKQIMIQRERFYEQILSGMSLGIIVLDENDNIIQTNNSAAKLLNLPSVNSLPQLAHVGKDIPETFRQLEANEKCKIEVHTSSGELQVSVRAAIMTLGEKRLKILTLNNIKNELDAKELDSWIKLTRVLTHEIMNGISPISSLSQTFMQKREIIESPYYEGIKAIYNTSAGLISFVDSYRKFSSLQKPSPKAFEVNELLSQIIKLNLVPPHIKLINDIQPIDLMLYADPNLIRQILINLIKNAVQAIGKNNGRIRIKAYVNTDEHVLIYVSNNGPSIPDDEAEQIFVPFYTTKKEGSGIGLSISRQIMKLSGGTISLVRNRDTEWTTTFVLEFE